jgi:hypothetical protein
MPVTYNCAADTRGEMFTPGLEHQGVNKLFDFKLVDVNPNPPARGNNTWTVEVDTMTNNTVGGPAPALAPDMTVTPFMPDHQHGSPITVDITGDATAGQYTLDPINLWMPGVWQTTISIQQGSAFDKAVYTFCLAE